jgi:hypothetical protein
VSGGEARRGRRDNGLVATEYAAAGDVDPRVGEHLLDVLALRGIAAYLRPSTDLNPITRSSSLPDRPTDRLYVDRAHLATARDYLQQLAQEAQAEARDEAERDDVDDAWAQIVAGFDDDGQIPTWPAAEDLPADDASERARRRDADTPRTLAPASAYADEPSLLEGLDTFGAHLPDDEDEGFTPPPPPPIPRPSLPTALSVIGIVGGLIVFLKPDLLPLSASLVMLTGFTAVVVGFATLVWRLRPGDDDDDIDPDDGARV